MISVFYKPFAVLVSVLGGLVAGAVFNRVWSVLPGQGEAPDPDDEGASWAEVLTSAAVHGAVYGTVKAVTKRAGAKSFKRATGTWPGDKIGDKAGAAA